MTQRRYGDEDIREILSLPTTGATRMRLRRVLPAGLTLVAALAMADAARYGWGAATIDGDRVKWGLRSIGRSPWQPVIVIKDFCWWHDGPRGLCTLVPGSNWAAEVFRWAAPAAWVAVAAFVLAALLLARQPGRGIVALLAAGVWTVALGVLAVIASHRIAIFRDAHVDPGWSGSLTWRFALLLTIAALVIANRGVGPDNGSLRQHAL